MSWRRHGWVGLVLICAGAGAAAQESSPPTNLTLIRTMLARAADSLAGSLSSYPPAQIALRVEPQEVAWLAEEQFGNRLRSAGWIPGAETGTSWAADVVLDEITVRYENPRQGGLFGSDLLDRSVHASVRVEAREGSARVLEERYTPSIRDTIAAADVEYLETSYLPFTRGRVPPGGFFSSILEPVVVIGTIAVAVLLLFTVRSS